MKNEHHLLTASYAGILTLMLGMLIAASYFVYHNFRDALVYSSDVLTLRSLVTSETINVKKWEEVTLALDKKQASSLADLDLADPFDPAHLNN